MENKNPSCGTCKCANEDCGCVDCVCKICEKCKKCQCCCKCK